MHYQDIAMRRSFALPTLPFRCRSLKLALALATALLPACNRGTAPPVPAVAPATAPAATASAAPADTVELHDSIETTPSYIVGISYPQVASKYPPLARAVHDYSEASRARLMQAVDALHGAKPPVPYDLSLPFASLVETPRVVAVAVDGSSYTGGAHGTPLVERFVWLPQMQQMLAAEQLIPQAGNWAPIAAFVRDQLMTQLSQQLDDDEVPPDQRAPQMRKGSALINSGTTPDVRNFSRFEPVMNADGSIRSLRFVFPPEQVAPYEDGAQSVEVPAKVLLPLVAPAYRPLFRAG